MRSEEASYVVGHARGEFEMQHVRSIVTEGNVSHRVVNIYLFWREECQYASILEVYGHSITGDDVLNWKSSGADW
ncbi:hypothetical protein [Reichenbachiella sp. 5M10]|uniref:hypothetical protein n=1 Tax=Reichenbachiella sp. 5M10 TaxID=1889772 RepID=UPI00117B853B|nr:hypothetical protein [Reichenbachiella sp. 5M10]